MPAMPDLNEEEFLELRVLLRHTIASDSYPMSPRLRRLRAILDKLDPPASRPEPHPASKPAGEPSLLLTRKKGKRR